MMQSHMNIEQTKYILGTRFVSIDLFSHWHVQAYVTDKNKDT